MKNGIINDEDKLNSKHIPDTLANLVRQMIDTNPRTRIKLKDVLNHD